MTGWRITLATGLLMLVHVAGAQNSSALSGTVLHPNGSVIRDAPVRARNDALKVDARTRSDARGHYEFRDLPAGTYLVTVDMPCCDFQPYAADDVVVGRRQEKKLEIALVLAGLSIQGDDPATLNAETRDRQVIPDLRVPRAADGHPDFSGVWLFSEDPYPEAAKALPAAQAEADKRIASDFADDPHIRCLPSGLPVDGASEFIAKFVQTPKLVILLSEGTPGFRQVFLDGRAHPDRPNPSWMGHSIGHWDGDTLVVDTVGFNDRGLVGPYPRTEKLHMVERYRRSDYGHLQVRVTFEDPGVFTAPWTWNETWDLAPQEELLEYVCENNKWAPEQ